MANRIKVTRVNAFWIIVVLLVVLSFINILILDVVFLRNQNKIASIIKSDKEIIKQPLINGEKVSDEICPNSCISEIRKATSSSEQKTYNQTTITSLVKESLITLGTGTNTSTDYENVLTTQVSIDPSKYGEIKSIKLEVSIAVPTANQYVYVRLYNITDKNPVWNSEMYMSGGPSANLISEPITLASGSKLYVVQMKSQLKAITNLNQARLRIETN